MTKQAHEKKVLVIGCGDLGQRCGLLLAQSGYDVYGAKRTDNLPEPIKYLPLDVTDAGQLGTIAYIPWDAVLITLTARGEDNYRRVYVEGMQNILSVLGPASLVLFASSASVYSQNDGSVVDESSVTEPRGFSGKTMLAAESLLAQSASPSAAIRFSGLYGGGVSNHLMAQLKSGHICPVDPVRYSNRIHIDDAARFMVHLVSIHAQGKRLAPVYIGSDGNPPTLRQLMEWLAAQEGIDIAGLANDYLPKRGGNRRYSNKLMMETGFVLDYPDFRRGFLTIPSTLHAKR